MLDGDREPSCEELQNKTKHIIAAIQFIQAKKAIEETKNPNTFSSLMIKSGNLFGKNNPELVNLIDITNQLDMANRLVKCRAELKTTIDSIQNEPLLKTATTNLFNKIKEIEALNIDLTYDDLEHITKITSAAYTAINNFGTTQVDITLAPLANHQFDSPSKEINELKNLTSQLVNIYNFEDAKSRVEKAINNSNNVLLQNSGKDLLAYIGSLERGNRLKSNDYATLANHLSAAASVINEPTDQSKLDKLSTSTKQAFGFKRSKGKALCAVLLGVLCAALITASILTAVATFGAAAPLTVVTGVLVGNMAAAITTISVTGLAGTSALVGMSIFAHKANKGELKGHLEQVQAAASLAQPQ